MSEQPSAEPGGGRPGPVLYVLLGLAVGVAATLAVVLVTDDGETVRSAASPPTTASPAAQGGSTTTTSTSVPFEKLDEDARELVALAGEGQRREFHARYTTSGAVSSAGQPFSVALELWNKPPRVRRNLSITTQGQVVESADIQGEDSLVRCGKPSAEAGWQCVTPPRGAANEPGAVAFGLAPGALAGRPVTATDETVTNQPAKCFEVGMGTESPEELCLSREGIPLRVTSGAAVLELETLELSVEDKVFEPPARPLGA